MPRSSGEAQQKLDLVAKKSSTIIAFPATLLNPHSVIEWCEGDHDIYGLSPGISALNSPDAIPFLTIATTPSVCALLISHFPSAATTIKSWTRFSSTYVVFASGGVVSEFFQASF
ncbi:hypothetical protein AGR1B_pa0185 [Agrobacterium fabacearum S56]|uniref:hypothetical protein n=1 Tax=Agrobacterium tumefaciens TaxID=358 RepID=UPI0009D5E596|nr:hypothetical protein [Agrobacterium tumefaciens]CUX06941.1 hypothetical protein AGR1B_pa0185 [Agrobacterium fabacearum S56]